jgi:nucleoside-diphosphate-sugar epimerase
MTTARIIVFGATGLVGRATVAALVARGADVIPQRAPRLAPVAGDLVRQTLSDSGAIVAEIARLIGGADAVVNAAGSPDAGGTVESAVMAPNALLPALLAQAARAADVPRLIHVSSAAVQGNRAVLDESVDVAPFSAYSRSKALGEALVLEAAPGTAVVYRPPGVHARDRRVTQLTAKLARSALSSVARPASAPSAQALLENVADAIAFLSMCPDQPPSVVIHPSEGLTTASVLSLLGGREPFVVPRPLAKLLVAAVVLAGRAIPALAANARRIEVLWFGQAQSRSWLTEAGWVPPAGPEAWRQLGEALADEAAHTTRPEPTDRTDDANESVR